MSILSSSAQSPLDRRIGVAITALVVLFLVGPVVLSILAGLTRNYFVGLSSGLTLRWVAQVWDLYQDTFTRTLGIAAATTVIVALIGIPVAWVFTVINSRTTRAFDALLTLPVAVPGLASALALIVSWGTIGSFRTSIGFIVVGHVLFTLPFMVRATRASMADAGLAQLDEAAATLGASRMTRFLSVIVPNAMPGITTGALTVATLSVGEFNLTWLLHTPLTKTLPIGLADSYASMRLEVASAYTLVFLLMLLPLLIAVQWLGTMTERRMRRAALAPISN